MQNQKKNIKRILKKHKSINYEGESKENLKIAMRIIDKYLRFSFDTPS